MRRAAAVLLFLHAAFACGPFLQPVRFVNSDWPGPQDRILLGTYRTAARVEAYRRLAALPVSPPPSVPAAQKTAVQEWMQARAKIPGAPAAAEPRPYRELERYNYYLNCGDDAFRTAARTLGERAAMFGAGSREVREWLAGQDTVFSNCGGGAAIPGPPAAGLDARIAQDREYQVAAAYFYSAQHDEALQRFRAIAADRTSAWSDWSAYAAARCLIRASTLVAEGFDRELMEQAETELKNVLADAARKPVHAAASRLLEYVRTRLDPETRLEELANTLAAPSGAATGPALQDFVYLFRKRGEEIPRTRDAALLDWIDTLEGREYAHAVERWNQGAGVQWLVAALVSARGSEPDLEGLLAAAAQVPAGSPAYASAVFHSVRLGGGSAQALDRLIAAPETSVSDRNLLRALRMRRAGTLAAWLRDAPRVPLEGSPRRLLLDADAAAVLTERMPLELVAAIAEGDGLPAHLRSELARAAWVRAVILSRDELALRLAALSRPLLSAYSAAQDADERRFAAAWILLHHPGLTPYLGGPMPRTARLDRLDPLRDNWWCTERKQELETFWSPDYYQFRSELDPALRLLHGDTVQTPAFLSPAQLQAGESEWKALRASPAAPTLLGDIIIRWVERHPRDPRSAEALHYTVRATRYGCADAQTSGVSRRAFRLLHRLYPGSVWARKTPFYF